LPGLLFPGQMSFLVFVFLDFCLSKLQKRNNEK